jgi:tRNA threonylcarbamoyladenosine biosynthesis protein TsaE
VLHHADLYRLDRTTEVADLALEDLADDGGIVLVEWGDVVEALFSEHLTVHLEADDDDETGRLVEISATGSTWASRWSRIVEACEAFEC